MRLLQHHLAALIGVIASLAVFTAAVPAPALKAAEKCANPIVRKEWRRMAKAEKQAYIAAVQCILTQPAWSLRKEVPGVVSRYDDLVAIHVIQLNQNHMSGRFLPWHRWYIRTYENMLRNECGYTGAQPYWDWTLDAPTGKFLESPLWDPVDGFGGNGPFVELPRTGGPAGSFPISGRTGGGCITDGPFKNMTVRIGPNGDLKGNPRCLTRDFSPSYAAQNCDKAVLDKVISQPNYDLMDRTMEGAIGFSPPNVHGGGHFSIGGTLGIMGDFTVSVGDPLFWMHHANLDRVWWSWQTRDLKTRLAEVQGPLIMNDYRNLQAGNATLETYVDVGVSAGPITILDTMDIENIHLCYTYDQLY